MTCFGRSSFPLFLAGQMENSGTAVFTMDSIFESMPDELSTASTEM